MVLEVQVAEGLERRLEDQRRQVPDTHTDTERQKGGEAASAGGAVVGDEEGEAEAEEEQEQEEEHSVAVAGGIEGGGPPYPTISLSQRCSVDTALIETTMAIREERDVSRQVPIPS